MFKRTKVCAAALICIGAGMTAQMSAQAQTLQRVEVTGSSIKRLDAETALPVTVITREQIERSGATSTEDLLKRVSANSAMLSDSTQGAGYATANANLRGLGANSTLVLLNGRRLANHPFGNIGGAAAVDLNSIPFAAIERIEVLRDGASAIYGTDAIGGVINFITRRDYRNGEVNVRVGDTQAKIGGSEKGASLAVGFGSLNDDRFNVLFTANMQKNSRVRAIDQAFYNRGVTEVPGSDPPSSSAPFPGYIGQSDGPLAPGSYPEFNLGSNYEKCGAPYSFVTVGSDPTPNGQERRGCRFIYAATLDNIPDQDKLDLFTRATFNWSPDHQLFAEASYARNHSIGRVAPTPIKYGFGPLDPTILDFKHVLMPVTSKYYPRALLTQLGYTVPDTGMAEIGLRAVFAGNRVSDNTNEQQRLVVGATGVIAGWDYDTAINLSKASGLLNYTGYVQEDRFLAALATGNLNPFGPGDAEHARLWASAAMDGDMRKSTSTTTEFDFKASKDLMAMAGGSMALALGVDLRREEASDTPINADYAAGKHIGGEGSVPKTEASRTLNAVFGELNIPFAKGWEAALAARYDSYSDFGTTFNPRATIRFQPSKSMLFRAAAGTGFRAPTLWDVNSPASFSNTADSVQDPACPNPAEVDGRCASQVVTKSTASSGLKPEKSKQFSFGAVFEPSKSLTIALDYWNVEKTDQIGVIAAESLLATPVLLSRFGNRVKRGSDGFILYVETPVDNLGNLKTSGIDLDIRGRIDFGGAGRLNLGLAGTYVLAYDAQKYAGGEFGSFVGTGGDGSVPPVPRWQHTASAEWVSGTTAFTLEQVYTRGWTESAASVAANIGVDAPYNVKDSIRYNVSAAYKGIKNVTARVGIRNLLDTEPPFTASSSYGSHAAGYAASFTDPRGRFFYVNLGYQFK
jgi:iron complex outermembrane receptor protein